MARRCMIVSNAVVEQCRALSEATAESAGANMWTTPLSASGTEPATHWISSGDISDSFAEMISTPEALAEGAGITVEQATVLLSLCDVSEEDPFAAMDRLGLKMIQPVMA